MQPLKILSPTAILGYGFPRASFERGMAENPDAIAVDAGSTDPGPAYLGMGKSFVDRAAVKRDLEIMLGAAVAKRIPVVVGTAGGSGARDHVDWALEIVREIARESGATLRVAVVYADVPRDTVLEALRAGRVRPLPFVPELTEQAVLATPRIVAQIGVEPVAAALESEPDLVLVGRCYDPAVFAALPARRGMDLGLALHMGKILECAAIAATPGSGRDCVLGVLAEDHFLLKPLSDARKFTCDSVAAHTLYEKSHPFLLPGPGGHLDLSETTFEQAGETSVRVAGSRFVPAQTHTLKIEGAAPAGFRTISICGVRDRIMIAQLDGIFQAVRDAVEDNFGAREFDLNFRVYGKDGVMGPLEPRREETGYEVGVLIDVVAPTQKDADTICGFARSTALHYGYPGRIATAGNLAFPFSPSDIPVGEVYEFSLYHLMDVDDPNALFPVETLSLGGEA